MSDDVKRLAALIAELETERDRWKEDSLRQAATINRLAEAAEDRNVVDANRQALYENDLHNAAAVVEKLKAERDALQARIRELQADLERSVNNARGLWIDCEQQAQRVRELEAALPSCPSPADTQVDPA